MEPPARRWDSPHLRRRLGPPRISDDAVAALRGRLREQPTIRDAYLVEVEIIEPSHGSSHVTNLALWLGGPEAETEMEVERRLQLDALAETFERGSLKMSFVTPAGLAAARRRGLRVL